MPKSSKDKKQQDENKLLSELMKNSKENLRYNNETLWFLTTKSMENNETPRG